MIEGQRGNLAVSVKITNGNYYKIHSILTPNGDLLVLENKKTEYAPAGALSKEQEVTPPIYSVTDSILDVSENSNIKKSECDIMPEDRELLLEAASRKRAGESLQAFHKKYEQQLWDEGLAKAVVKHESSKAEAAEVTEGEKIPPRRTAK